MKLANKFVLLKFVVFVFHFHFVFGNRNLLVSRKSIRIRSPLSETVETVEFPKDIAIVGAPVWRGQKKIGVDYGPTVIRDAKLAQLLESGGHKVTDYGDISTNAKDTGFRYTEGSHVYNLDYVRHETEQLTRYVENALDSNDACVVLGGDHTVTIGSVYGHAAHAKKRNQEIALIYIDAHADINSLKTSASGNIHGMVLTFILQEFYQFVKEYPYFENHRKPISSKRLAHLALRFPGRYEKYFFDRLNISSFPMHKIDRIGVLNSITSAISHVTKNCASCSLHVSFDIDSVDPVYAPATGTPVPGGLTIREALTIAEEIHKTGLLRVVDITEVNPLLAPTSEAETTAEIGAEFVGSLFGVNTRSGKHNAHFDMNLVRPY